MGAGAAAGCLMAWNAMFPAKPDVAAPTNNNNNNSKHLRRTSVNTVTAKTIKPTTSQTETEDRLHALTAPSHAHGFSLTQLVERNAQCFGDRVACIHPDGSEMTYKTFAKRVATVGTSLRRVLGLGSGARCAVLAPNSVEYLELFFAIAWAGGWIVPINTRFSVSDVTRMLNDCSCDVLVVDAEFAKHIPQFQESVQTLRKIVYLGDSPQVPGNAIYYQDLATVEYALSDGNLSENKTGFAVDKASTRGSAGVYFDGDELMESLSGRGDDVYGLFYTSGTMGRAKGVMLTHTNVLCNAYGVIGMLHIKTSSRYLHAAPMFHAADACNTFAVVMAAGQHCFVPNFEPRVVMKRIAELHVTVTMMVPTMIAMIAKLMDAALYDCSCLELLLYGSSPMPPSVLSAAFSLFPNADFVQGYGMTETSPVITYLGSEHHVKNGRYLSSVGQPLPHAQVIIADPETGRALPPNTVGEIITRGPHVMRGYWNLPEETAHTLRQGWLHTGDGGYMDERGFVYLRERLKDMVVSGGENIFSSEVEQRVSQMPLVVECAVIGIPDRDLVEKVAAIVVVDPDSAYEQFVTPSRVVAFCRKELAGFKCPRHVVVRTEPLPRSTNGKVLKAKLREPYWSHSE